MASSDGETIETAALGRPFQLGMLYDCRKDALIPAITLWDNDQLQKNTTVQQMNNTEFNITTSDSMEEKTDSLKVSGSLKLSLLGGLVEVKGSAKYFQDTKTSLKQARVILQHKTTTKFETLTMAHLGRGQVSHPNVFEDDTATHVVTAILYGAGAYFVFDRETSSDDRQKQVEGDANIAFNKLKFLTVDAEATLNMNNEEKAAVDKFSCTFHGDFKLPTNPTSFSDAVSVYKNLPNMLGDKGEQAVPVRVWLYPLVKLDSRAAKLQRYISNSLTRYSSEIIESLNVAEMRCNDILKDTAAATFPAMKNKIQTFRQNCHQYKIDLMQNLGSVLSSIRGGGKEESVLEDILKTHEQSPFNSKELDQWLKNKEKESDLLKSYLKNLGDIGVAVDETLDDLSDNTVVCFYFTSVDQTDSFLVKLSNYLKPAGMRTSTTAASDGQSKDTEWLSTDTKQKMKKQLKLFKELKKLNSCSDIKFTVASKYDENHPGACIFVNVDGCDEAVCFVPPQKPATPTSTTVDYNSLTVKVFEPNCSTAEYRVEYRVKQEVEWTSHPIQKNQETVMLKGLKPDTEYEIRATAVGRLGYAVSSDAFTAVTDKAVGPPTKINVTEVKANTVTLTWNVPLVQHCKFIKGYIIEYKENNSNSDWQTKETMKELYTFTLSNLKQNTEYSIRMRTDVGNGVSEPSKELMTQTTKAPLDKKSFTCLSGTPPVYLLNLKPAEDGTLHKMVFGSSSVKHPSNKTVMLVGATGSGKTTLINGMINYVLGVEWEDDWRFKLIDEQTNLTQACSQTSEVTAYQIHHTDKFQVEYSLTIIDTPGFGDTRGIKQDKEITERIRRFFSVRGGVDGIDAVCFVVQSALARLTHTQKYIFDAILSIFGKDIANNITILVTFADGKEPPVLEAIKAAKLPCAKNSDESIVHFKFNNSVLFANNTAAKGDENNFDHMFWKLGKASMKTFFNQLAKMKTQSLTLTKEVLEERKQLETTVEGVQPMIRIGLSKLEEINTTKAALENHKTHMEENKDFEYEVETDQSDKVNIPSGTFITNCHGCNYTCHYPCTIPRDENKRGCDAMKNGNCTVCPGKCVWSVHFNMTYRWDIKRVKEKRTYQELKSKYEEAMGKTMDAEKIIKHLEVEYEQMQNKVIAVVGVLTKCLSRLKEIALRPDPLSTPDYIDLLIQSEEQEAKPGYKNRIKELNETREGAILLQKVAEGIILTKKETSKFDKMKSKMKGIYNSFVDLVTPKSAS